MHRSLGHAARAQRLFGGAAAGHLQPGGRNALHLHGGAGSLGLAALALVGGALLGPSAAPKAPGPMKTRLWRCREAHPGAVREVLRGAKHGLR